LSTLLQKSFGTKFETAPFSKIDVKDFLPAFKESINQAKQEIVKILSNSQTDFQSVCVALEQTGQKVDRTAVIFFNLHHANTSDEMQEIAKEFSSLQTEFENDISMNPDLFKKVKTVWKMQDSLELGPEKKTLLDKQYKRFVRNGALLNEGEKEKLRAIDKELSQLSLQFGDNVLAETKAFELWIDNEADLAGLPDSAKEAAALLAKEKEKEGKWLFTLDHPSYIPLITYSEKRELREQIWRARTSLAFQSEKNDNRDIVKKIANLRYERANLLGYKTHAHFVLEERMAKSPETVIEFTNNLLAKARPHAEKELQELIAFAKDQSGLEDFRRWDSAYWGEKLKLAKFDFDDEKLRPFLKLDNVINGAFSVANKLYKLQFKEDPEIEVYHEDVKAYEVTDKNGKHVGIFYTDFFPRDGKRNGAWMTIFREQRVVEGVEERPHVSIVCNFTRPTADRPSLLTLNEALTLFHEFGHSLHGLLAKGNYASLSGANVFWDFVELPSQIMENWVYEKECLDLFAVHFETGEKIPQELVDKMVQIKNFHEGMGTLRQLSLGILDMAWHGSDPNHIDDVGEFEKKMMGPAELLPLEEGDNKSCAFGHIFEGGYSSGYYSYKWAEVLDADAFEYFKEKGIFNNEVADSFRTHILSKGGSEHPMDLYVRFRGKKPTPDALLKRAGLTSNLN